MKKTDRSETSNAESLATQRRELPDEPGVYMFRDSDGGLLYVGKALSIRKRVGSHFSKKDGRNAREMIPRIATIESLVCETEAEALITEQNFIRQHRPRFNVMLRDDKSYPYIGVSLDEEYPRVYFTREKPRPRRVYFGPFSSPRKVRNTLDLLGKLFQYRTCDGPEPGRRSGVPCLDYYIKRCGGPCVDYISKEEYRSNIDRVVDFLSGRYSEVAGKIESEMKAAAAAQDFERAAVMRDRLDAISVLMERQRVAGASLPNADVLAVAVEGSDANAQVFQIRDGILAERQSFYLTSGEGSEDGEVAEEFLLQYYAATPAIPSLLVVGPELRERTEVLTEALAVDRDQQVEVRVAERGDLRKLREMAEKNARLALGQEMLRQQQKHRQRAEALSELQEALGMKRLPMRIEGFDISNLGATHTVASMVVFESGVPKKADYRKFSVRFDSEDGADRADSGRIDDFAAMREVVGRRIGRGNARGDDDTEAPKVDESFSAIPDLIVIDGGKGQLSAAMSQLGELVTDEGVTVIGLAKRLEEVFVPGRGAPIMLAPGSDALRLLQRVRDEAHRFALGYHRNRRDKAMTSSALDGVRGVGPARKKALIAHFGSPDGVMSASRKELEAVPGVPGKLAREIHRQLHRAE
jgi:excinuclease ABC subunit C